MSDLLAGNRLNTWQGLIEMRAKYFSAGRCPSVSGQGLRCGLPKGHDDEHCALTETDAPWFDQGPSNPEGHQWRECKEGEPREEGGVCVRCGAWATSEQFKPCEQEIPS